MDNQDPAQQIAKLQARLATEDDPDVQQALEERIAKLQAQLPNSRSVQTQAQGLVDASGNAHISGAAVGLNQGNVIAPLFQSAANGTYIAGVMNLYGTETSSQQADYGAALRRYLEHLYTRHALIDLRGIDDRPMDMPLTELYVSLLLHEPPPDELRQRGGLRGFVEKVRDQSAHVGDEPEDSANLSPDMLRNTAPPEPVDWTAALRHPRLAVIGPPGCGKTTLLQYTTVRLAEILVRDDSACLADLGLANGNQPHDMASVPPVPLLLPLREFGAFVCECRSPRVVGGANPRLILDCLINYYNRFELALPKDFFSRLCEDGRAMLLLDGLDEVTRSEDRVFISSVVQEFALRYPTCRYVVTSRVAAYHGDARIGAGFRICTVADLSPTQQQRFIANWSRSMHRLVYGKQGEMLDREAKRYADDLWHALQLNPRVRDLATNPLLLTVVAVIFYNNYVLPEDRASLYEECVEVLLRGGRGKADRPGQERQTYSGKPQVSMGLNPRRDVLAGVAYTMHQRGEKGVMVERNDLVRMVSDQLRNRPDGAEIAQAFVEELPVHIGLLDEREPDRYRFSHLSFQEFLAARYIAETDRWDELLVHYRESWWREVILLCAGHLSQERCWRFLGQLIQQKRSPLDHSLALALATDALMELERFKGQGPLNQRIIADALAILEAPPHDAPAAARIHCGRVLARLGDPRPGVCVLPPPMVFIAGGTFIMGSSREEAERAGKEWERYYLDKGEKETAKHARTWTKNEINSQPVTVAPFELARYPITNAHYQLFMADGGYDTDQPWWDGAGRTWLRRDDNATEGLDRWQKRQHKDHPEWWDHDQLGIARTNHPVVSISWYEAMAFCRWLTQHKEYNPEGYIYRLPTEAEWEFASRTTARRIYPWSNEPPDDERANYGDENRFTTAVGCYPLGRTPEGLDDMAGNTWDWTSTIYRDYPYDPHDGREHTDNPAAEQFCIRGGGWGNPGVMLRACLRVRYPPGFHSNFVGFRLARSLPSR